MLYHILYPLRDSFIGFNLLGYITVRSAAAAVVALLVTVLIGPGIIRWLKRQQITEEIREYTPETHQNKVGTPSMGGVIIIFAVLVPVLLLAKLDNHYIQLMLVATLWMGAVGFLDDYLKVVKKLPKGLIAKYKLLGQILLGLIVATVVTLSPEYANVKVGERLMDLHWRTTMPFFKDMFINFWWFFHSVITILTNSFII